MPPLYNWIWLISSTAVYLFELYREVILSASREERRVIVIMKRIQAWCMETPLCTEEDKPVVEQTDYCLADEIDCRSQWQSAGYNWFGFVHSVDGYALYFPSIWCRWLVYRSDKGSRLIPGSECFPNCQATESQTSTVDELANVNLYE